MSDWDRPQQIIPPVENERLYGEMMTTVINHSADMIALAVGAGLIVNCEPTQHPSMKGLPILKCEVFKRLL
jgi:hypothetical protein